MVAYHRRPDGELVAAQPETVQEIVLATVTVQTFQLPVVRAQELRPLLFVQTVSVAVRCCFGNVDGQPSADCRPVQHSLSVLRLSHCVPGSSGSAGVDCPVCAGRAMVLPAERLLSE